MFDGFVFVSRKYEIPNDGLITADDGWDDKPGGSRGSLEGEAMVNVNGVRLAVYCSTGPAYPRSEEITYLDMSGS